MTNSEKLYKQIKILNRTMRRLSHGEPHGGSQLSHSQINFLKTISDNPGIHQREIGKVLNIRPSAIAEVTAKLVDMGLVSKEKDKNDRRIFLLFLTDKGEHSLTATLQNKKEFESGFFDFLTNDEVETALQLISKINQSLDEINQ